MQMQQMKITNHILSNYTKNTMSKKSNTQVPVPPIQQSIFTMQQKQNLQNEKMPPYGLMCPTEAQNYTAKVRHKHNK